MSRRVWSSRLSPCLARHEVRLTYAVVGCASVKELNGNVATSLRVAQAEQYILASKRSILRARTRAGKEATEPTVEFCCALHCHIQCHVGMLRQPTQKYTVDSVNRALPCGRMIFAEGCCCPFFFIHLQVAECVMSVQWEYSITM